MAIDISRLGPAAQKQIREKLAEKKRQQGTGNTQKGTGRQQGTGETRAANDRPYNQGGGTGTTHEGHRPSPTENGSARYAPHPSASQTPSPEGEGLKRKNKLNAVKVDGYASKHEAERAAELRWLEKAGKIRDLQEQVKFVLIPAKWEEIPRIGKRGKPIKPKRVCLQRELSYIADFCYIDCATGHTVVEDAKGYKGGATYRVFKDKAKMMFDKYGIKVVEV